MYIKKIKISGDICVMTDNNREKKKRRLEAKTTQKTIIIMSTFISCRTIFLLVIVFRQIPIVENDFFSSTYNLTTDQITKINVFYLIELILIVISFISCFLNSFTFIMLTENIRNQAHEYILKVYNTIINSKCKKSNRINTKN